MLHGWFALIIEYPIKYSLSSLSGIVEPKNVSDKRMMSMLFALINASIKGTLTKPWAAILLRFQWQKFSLEDFIVPGLISMSCDCNDTEWDKSKSIWLECIELKATVVGILNKKIAE